MSFGLPPSTEVSRQLPKKAIIERFGLSGKERTKFDSTIHRITISNEVSPRTVNIPEGKDVKSIFILKVELQDEDYDEKVISLLLRLIEQNMVLVLESGAGYRPLAFREVLIQGDWTQDLDLHLNGLDMDDVWEDLIKQVGNIVVEEGNDLDSQIAIDEECRKLDSQIEKLRKKMSSEKQPRRKRELYSQLKELESKRASIRIGDDVS